MPIDLINIVKSVSKELNFNVTDFANELESRLKNMSKEKYTVDRFEGEFAVCENRETKQIKNIKKEELPENTVEGTIIELEDGKITVDEKETKQVAERIKKKWIICGTTKAKRRDVL